MQFLYDVETSFLDAIRAAGMEPPATMTAGKLTRFPGKGKRKGNQAGWAFLFLDRRGGVFGDWSSSLNQTWIAGNGSSRTKSDYLQFKGQVAAAKAEVARGNQEKHDRAAEKAGALLAASIPADFSHPYLTKKGITPVETLCQIDLASAVEILRYAPKSNNQLLDGQILLAPICVEGRISSVELIDQTGLKHAIFGGARKGGFWAAKPLPNPTADAITILVGEGVATVISAVQATGHYGIAAFSNQNLKPVCQSLRKNYPWSKLVVLTDLLKESGNPDPLAIAAAQSVNGVLAVPDFYDTREAGDTDFNDLQKARGIDEVRNQIDSAIAASNSKAVAHVVDSEPSSAHLPELISFSTSGGKFCVSPRGVEFVGNPDEEGNYPDPKWICSQISVTAKTRNAESSEWGYLLDWKDGDGIKHAWAMPASMLQGEGSEVRRILAGMGVSISPKKMCRDLMTSFFQDFPVERRARSVDQLGWLGNLYVSQNETIGDSQEVVVFQNEHAIHPAVSSKGLVSDWRDSIAKLSQGNSRLVFSISVSLAGPLLDLIGADSGGFHIRGASSTGKSSALAVAASVWGQPNKYLRLWRATANGLESLASLHNDCTLILDELSQMVPNEAGEAAYLLANGRGKARAQQNGMAAKSSTWRLLILSAGEESLSALMARANQKSNTGQEIRLADIPSDAGAGMGLFENIHGYSSPAEFALAIKDSSMKSYGSVGRQFLDNVVKERAKLPSVLRHLIKEFLNQVVGHSSSGQIVRVAQRFAIVAMAGELATSYGLTGWKAGESIEAAKKCFEAWHEGFGGSENQEERKVLSQFRAFFEAHGDSRFTDENSDKDRIVANRVGYKRIDENNELEYLVLPEAFKNEICKSLDSKYACRVLVNHGWLIPGSDGKNSKNCKVSDIKGTIRLYVIKTSNMWADAA